MDSGLPALPQGGSSLVLAERGRSGGIKPEPCARRREAAGYDGARNCHSGLVPESKRDWNTMKTGYVYILASKFNGTLYVGVTSDLLRRVYEHRNDLVDEFTKKYGVHDLVYYEDCGNIETAITQEKQIKGWRRMYKMNVINKFNPEWRDLYAEL
ncbi:MAG: GIY-YIG nuclease family protein [Syntrophomonadaceae bacterium]|jgi:putative endonuclease|nr:GIY-YIG nuclease family protein [Syntrophomonadaceae bacterium]